MQPDFVGVGTMDSGSGWWLDLLLRHPDIEPPRGRDAELHFFNRFCAREMTGDDVARYHGSFRRRPGRISGEWTPRYMYDVWTPPLLARAAPDAKLLVMVVDQIERYRLRIARARRQAPSEDAQVWLSDTVGRARSASQLRALLPFYDQDRILVLQFEKCRADPAGEYARTLRFLGVADDYRPRQLLQPVGRGISAKPYVRALRSLPMPPPFGPRPVRRLLTRMHPPEPVALWPDLEESLHAELDPEVEALKAMVPGLDLSLWPNFAHLGA